MLALILGIGVPLLLVVQLAYVLFGPNSLWSLGILLPAAMWGGWAVQIPRRVDLYQNGIDYRAGRRHRYLFWNQVCEVYQTPLFTLRRRCRSPKRPDIWMYRLVQRDGRSLRLYHMESIRMLGQRIQEQVARRHLPATLDAFRGGYSIRFGRHLSVSVDGLRFCRKSLSWHEISEISIDETAEVRVIPNDRSQRAKRLSIRHVPNLLLLDGVLRASQDSINADSPEVDVERGALFDDVRFDSVRFDPSGAEMGDDNRGGDARLLPEDEAPEPADPGHQSFRPRRPK